MSALLDQWRRAAQVARAWRSGEDPEPVLEALALSAALELLGELGRIPATERDGLRRLGQRALLQVGGPDLDDEELEAMRMCAVLARDGLRALAGGQPADPALPVVEAPGRGEDGRGEDGAPAPGSVAALVPAGDVARLLGGRLDGFAAAALVARIRRSPTARAELRVLASVTREAEPEPRTFALAAASASPVLDPAQGVAVGALPELGAEAVLFPPGPGELDRRLAVYAEDPEPLRLVADALTTEDVREGYWVGRVAGEARRLDAVLEIGDRAHAWVLELP